MSESFVPVSNAPISRRRLSAAIRYAVMASCIVNVAQAQPTFKPKVVDSTADFARAVFAADMDGDGDTDVLSVSGGDAKIAWYENNGSEDFRLRTIATNAYGANSIFAADLDGDGDVDVLSGSSTISANKIAWYENDGNENFALRTIATNTDIESIFAADVDGDGDMDVLSASRGDDLIAWYENDGNENFTFRAISTSADYASSVFAADVDGDGDTDVLSSSSRDDKIAWYENDGAITPTFSPHSIATNIEVANSVFAADVDGDGDTDVLSASFISSSGSTGLIAWYQNDGNQTFSFHTIATVAGLAESVFAADLDGDGDTDVLSASNLDDKIAWYENDGSENFSLHTITTNADAAASVFAADVDGDGDTDVLSASSYDDKIAWYENDARDVFSPFSDANTFADTFGSSTDFIFAADVDGDGDIDMLSANRVSDRIAWHENDANQSFTLHTITTGADSASSVFATDIDGDGDTDVLSSSRNDDKIAWYENDGNQNFVVRNIATNADGAWFVSAADVDGDGDTDVLSASSYDNKIAWYENDGNEVFTLHTIASFFGARSVFALDADGDGDVDLFAGSPMSEINWFDNDGNGTFTQNTLSSEENNPSSIFAADMDGDGDIDVLSTSSFDDTINWYENDGNQSFTLRAIMTNAPDPYSIIAADADGDGDMDIVWSGRTIAWHENDGKQDFTLRTIADSTVSRSVIVADVDKDGDSDVLAAPSAWYENRTIHRSAAFDGSFVIATDSDGAMAVYAADIDGDGDTDILSASYNDNKIVWYENDGFESFNAQTIDANNNGANAVFVKDFDGDGDRDILSASAVDDEISWYENDGNQNFTKRVVATNAPFARSVYAIDIDRDGDSDVLSASQNDDKIAWYENDGSQSFTTHTITTTADNARSVFATDMDGDGDIDVLSASANDNKIAWYENDGSQNFTLRTISLNADGAYSVFAADVDLDGDIDVLSASANDNKIAWYENDGSQTFTLRTITTGASVARSVFAADMDGDGDIDVQSASSGDNKIAWYENDGSQSFTLRTITTSAEVAFSVFAADVDSDGDTDVLSASLNDDKIAWYENCGGQFLFGGQALSQAASFEGATIGVLTLDYLHNGRAGDNSANLDSLSLQVSDSAGNPLNSAQARGFLADLRIYLDNGDGSFDASSDTLLTMDALLDLTPRAFTDGTIEIDLTNTDVVLEPGFSNQLFVATTLASGAASQPPGSFQVALNQTPLPRPQAQDDSSGSVMSLECGINIQSALITPIPPVPVNLSVDTNTGTESNQTTITLTAIADAAVSGPQSVDLAVSGSGIGAGDFVLSATKIVIADGQTAGTETFTIQEDDVLEGIETATVNILNPSAGLVLDTNLSEDISITDNDTASLAINDVTVSEADGTATFTVALTGDVQGGLSVDYATADDSALAGGDYSAASGTLNFTGTGGETQTFSVNITDDALLEGSEQFFANLANPSNGVTLADAQGVGTINDNDAASLAINDVTVSEADGTATFTVALTGDVQGGLSVDYATGDDSAVAGSDYTATSGTLNFAGTGGETQTFTVNITDDALLEGSEQFFANLANPTNGVTLADAQGVGIINDNDAASLAINDVTVSEADGTATFTVALTGDVQGGLSVDYATGDDSAVAGSDYTAASGTLNFTGTGGETQTFTVNITDDALLEGSEQFFANLANPSNGVTLADAQGVGTINDNDAASLAINDLTVSEADGTATFTVALTGDVQGGLSVDYATADDSAVAGSDYTAASGTLNFVGTSGEVQTFTVNLTDDEVLEGTEQFFAKLSNPSNSVTVTDAHGAATINDNDAASLGINDVLVDESDGSAVLTVTLEGGMQDGLSVAYATVDGTALAGGDFTDTSGILNFLGSSGETQAIAVILIDDTDPEPSEQFSINLSDASNGVSIADAEGLVTIKPSDRTEVIFRDRFESTGSR
jgi:hypothetical protein